MPAFSAENGSFTLLSITTLIYFNAGRDEDDQDGERLARQLLRHTLTYRKGETRPPTSLRVIFLGHHTTLWQACDGGTNYRHTRRLLTLVYRQRVKAGHMRENSPR